MTTDTKKTCTATKKNGTPCRANATTTGLCVGHSPATAFGIGQDATEMQRRSAVARSEKARKAKLSLRERLAEELERHSGVLVSRLLSIARAGNDADALRAIESMLSRVYGKPTEHLVTEDASNPEDLSLSELERERKRLAVLVEGLDQVTPRVVTERLTERPKVEH